MRPKLRQNYLQVCKNVDQGLYLYFEADFKTSSISTKNFGVDFDSDLFYGQFYHDFDPMCKGNVLCCRCPINGLPQMVYL